MFKLKEIVEQFSYLIPKKTSSFEEVFISGISTPDLPVENTLILIKSTKFFDNLIKLSPSSKFEKLLLVVPTALESELNLEKFSYLVSEKSIDQVMVDISKMFYELFEENTQCLLDGRQIGNTKIDPSAQIAQGVFIGENVEVGADSVIMPGTVIMPGSIIGKHVKVFPRVTIYPKTIIRDEVTIHSGSIIGSDGFGYNQLDGEHKKVFHLGNVIIEENVEIGANCTIDRGTFGPTIIGRGSKLDNLVHLAHNCILDENVIVCGQSGLAGSVRVGKFSMLSGHVGVAPGVEIGEKAQVGGHSAVTGNLEGGQVYSGYPARPLKEWLRSQATLRKLAKK
tara:strand:- start:6861 stop:7874 length:1014 start_codon:yes stop_codon:yes gene_type:complete